MSSPTLRAELGWFSGGSLAFALCCLILGLPLATTLLFMAGYAVWILFRMNAMVNWLRAGAKPAKTPQTIGLTDELVDLIHREKKYSRKQKNRYRNTLAQFNSLAADLPDATIVLNKDFDIRWANQASLTLLNIHADKDRGQRVDNLFRDPDFKDFLYNYPPSEQVEIKSPVDASRVLALRKVPTGNKMMVLIAADITQQVQVREMRKAFVADVSHELRTPLTVIRGYLEMLQENESIDTDASDALQQIVVHSNRMHGIVEDLLELSKLEANPLADFEGDTVNISAMIQSIVNPLKKNAISHEFLLNVDESLAVLGSERELYSICDNLLNNAIKYTEPGARIVVSWKLDADGSALFDVSDNGPGIESRHLNRLSERFYRVDQGRSRAQGGTGLGLAIVKHAAHRHGGALEINSTPGSGSSFAVRFPDNRALTLAKAVNQ